MSVFWVLLSLWLTTQNPSEHEQVEREVLDQLSRGEIPTLLIEEKKVIDPKSQASIEFSQKMNEILDPVFPDLNLAKRPIRFVVFESPHINGFIKRTGQPPIIAISTTALRRLTSLDQILTLIGHEIGHLVVGQKYKPGQNSKGEEYFVDLYPLRALDEAGYDVRESILMFEALQRQQQAGSQPLSSRFGELLDVHGLTENRLKAIKNFVASIDHERGGLRGHVHPTPDWIEVMANARHHSHLRSQVDFDAFEDLSLDEQLKILEHHIQDLKRPYRSRAADYRMLLHHLNVDPQSPNDVDKATALANKLLSSQGGRDVYTKLTTVVSKSGAPHPIGALKELSLAVSRFVRAKTDSEIVSAAHDVQALLRSHPEWTSQFLSELKWSNFKLPDRRDLERFRPGHYEVPWNQHFYAASRTKNQNVFETFLFLGIREARAVGLWPPDLLKKFGDSQITFASSTGPSTDDYSLDELAVDNDGQIVGIAKEPRHTVATRFYNRILDRVPLPERMIKTILESIEREHRTWVGLTSLPEGYSNFLKLNAEIIETILSETSDGQLVPQILRRFREILDAGGSEGREIVRDFFVHLQSRISTPSTDTTHPFFNFVERNSELFSGVERMKMATEWGRFNHLGIFANSLVNPSASKSQQTKKSGVSRYRELSVETKGHLERKLASRTQFSRKHLDYRAPKRLQDLNQIFDELILQGVSRAIIDPVLSLELVVLALQNKSQDNELEHLKFLQVPKALGSLDADGLDDSHVLFNLIEDRLIKPRKSWPSSTLELHHLYTIYNQSDLLRSTHPLRFEVLTKLKAALNHEPSAEVRLKVLEEVILASRIQDPDLRRAYFRAYIDEIHRQNGLDLGHKDYQKKILDIIKTLKDKLPPVDFVEIVWQLADRLETQRALTRGIQRVQFQIKKEHFKVSQGLGVAFEGILLFVQKHLDLRDALVNYIMSGGTDDDIDRFRDFMSAHYPEEGTSFGLHDVKLLYANFWTSPLSVRIGLMDMIVFTPLEATDPTTVNRGFERILERVFPKGSEYADEAKSLVRDYLGILPDYQRGLLASALLVAAHRDTASASNDPLSLGEKLAIVLEMMGPAEIKLGQAAHSNPRIADRIRNGLARLKGRAAPPHRGELFDLFYEVVPAKDRKGAKVKRLLGSASYFVVFEVTNAQGQSEVFAVLRPHAVNRANQGFERMLALAHKRGPNDPLYQILMSLIKQGQRMSKIETDARANVQQNKIAKRLYDGLTIDVGTKNFKISVAEIIASGKGWKKMKKAPGVSFIDLPDQTDDQRSLKSEIARAIVTMELHILLKGEQFDHDRHGAQLHIDGDQITLYDFGAMSLEPPTAQERQWLSEVMVSIIQAYQSEQDLSDVIFRKISEIHAATGEVPPYLSSLQKSILALSDFVQYIPREDFVSVIKAAMDLGIHPQIQEALMNELARRPELIEKLAPLMDPTNAVCKGPLIKLSRGRRAPQ